MQKVISFFLLTCLLLPFGIKIGVVSDYLIRYDHYVNELCENKDKPELHCNGTCQLAQNLQVENDDTPEEPIVPEISKVEISDFYFNELNVQFTETTAFSTSVEVELNQFYVSIHKTIPTPPPNS